MTKAVIAYITQPTRLHMLLTGAALTALGLVTFHIRFQAAQALIVPSYFDSAEHVRLIKLLMSGLSPADVLREALNGYYHLGYHTILAIVAQTVQADPVGAVRASGPVMLAAFPLGVFGLLRRHTGSAGALLGALLAAWGWSMPAYALNWGKYPLLAGLTLLPFTLAAGQTAHTNRRWLRLPLFGLLALLTALLHTRLVAVMSISVIAWLTTQKMTRLPRYFTFGLPLAAVIGMGALTAADPMLAATFSPYLNTGWPISALVVALLPFALRVHAQTAQSSLLMMAAMLAGLHIPAGGWAAGQTVLDRPLVETALCLPLAVLSGLGLDGLTRTLRHHWSAAVSGISVVAVLFHAAWVYDPRPACCVIFVEADAVALDWMADHLPPETRILTAAVEMRVSPRSASTPLAGADAGVWIAALTGHRTLPALYGTDFSAPATLQALCANQVTHIYIGGAGQTFDPNSLQARPAWYKRIFSMPPASLYQVTGCGD